MGYIGFFGGCDQPGYFASLIGTTSCPSLAGPMLIGTARLRVSSGLLVAALCLMRRQSWTPFTALPPLRKWRIPVGRVCVFAGSPVAPAVAIAVGVQGAPDGFFWGVCPGCAGASAPDTEAAGSGLEDRRSQLTTAVEIDFVDCAAGREYRACDGLQCRGCFDDGV